MNQVTVVGSYNKGLTITTDRVPYWGETLEGENFNTSHGGKGSNQAVAASRLGAKVNFIGAIGDDSFGHLGYEMLKEEQIDVSGVTQFNGKNTGVGIIFLDKNGENCIIIDKGANAAVTEEYVGKFKNLIESSDVLVVQLEIPLESVKRAMKIANENDILVILNPAPATPDAKNLVQYADIINPNETELLILNGLDPGQELDEEECIHLARKLLEKGPRDIIVTRGKKGAIHVNHKTSTVLGAQTVVSKDSTGAGDAFTGALAYSLSNERNINESLELALSAGSYCVTQYGVLNGLADYKTLKQFEED